MAREFAQAFYKSYAWKQCEKAYKQYRHGVCERCHNQCKPKDGKRRVMIVHHKERLTPMNINDPRVTLGWDNLELLCIDCHNKEHGHLTATRDDVMFDDRGNLVKNT